MISEFFLSDYNVSLSKIILAHVREHEQAPLSFPLDGLWALVIKTVIFLFVCSYVFFVFFCFLFFVWWACDDPLGL